MKGLNFRIAAGTKVGVVGRTGAGKSTLAMALTRLVEIEKGQILIDNQDIGSVDLDDLRQNLTVIA